MTLEPVGWLHPLRELLLLRGGQEAFFGAASLSAGPESVQMVAGSEPAAQSCDSGPTVRSTMRVKRAFIYILRCADDTFYIGTARDVAKRLALHNARKGAKYTKARLPVRVVYQEGPMTLTRALRREYQLKQLTRSQKQALIQGELVVKRPR